MESSYQNKDEDNKAIELIIKSNCKDLIQIKKLFKENLIPIREKYFFYFFGKQHSINMKDKNQWGTDMCKFKFYGVQSDWWESYLPYYRSMKMKIYGEIHPKLSKMEYSDEFEKDKNLHKMFIEKGYFYQEQIEKSFEHMFLLDIDDPNADWNGSGTLSIFQVDEELKRIDEEYDSYKFIEVRKKIYVDSEWCPACHESPCMCSDPF